MLDNQLHFRIGLGDVNAAEMSVKPSHGRVALAFLLRVMIRGNPSSLYCQPRAQCCSQQPNQLSTVHWCIPH